MLRKKSYPVNLVLDSSTADESPFPDVDNDGEHSIAAAGDDDDDDDDNEDDGFAVSTLNSLISITYRGAA